MPISLNSDKIKWSDIVFDGKFIKVKFFLTVEGEKIDNGHGEKVHELTGIFNFNR